MASPDAPDPESPPGPIWTRLAADRPLRSPVTRDAIVTAAIKLADAEGFDAVSIRRVAAALDTRPMGLYSHIARKDDLLDLMLDRLAGDWLLGAIPSDWQDGLRTIARRSREAALNHPWIVAALGRPRSLGPNVLRHVEQSLAALDGLSLSAEQALAVISAVDTFVLGHLVNELAAREAVRRDDFTPAARRSAMVAYVNDAAEDDPQLRRIAALGAEALFTDGIDAKAAEAFDRGLEWLLSGIAASLNEA